MPFTEDGKRKWHDDKRRRENASNDSHLHHAQPAAVCLHCSNPFGINDGVVTDDAAICNVCLGD